MGGNDSEFGRTRVKGVSSLSWLTYVPLSDVNWQAHPSGEPRSRAVDGEMDRFERHGGGTWKNAHRRVIYDWNYIESFSSRREGPFFEL
jgi:hypothetical protein